MTGLPAAALGYAERGWPVFPCKPGRKAPNTEHGFKDATTDAAAIRDWWTRHPYDNVAIATGRPAIDVLDVDNRPGGSGFAALNRLKHAGLLTGAMALVRTRSGGLHLYFTGTDRPCGKLSGHFLDFKAAGGYVLAPPSWVEVDDQGPAGFYELIEERDTARSLDWRAVRMLLDPPGPRMRQPAPSQTTDAGRRFDGIVAYLSGLKDGDQRWRQLHWAAVRAAEFIAAGTLTEDAARAALMDAARVNGFIADHGEAQAVRKIDRGLSQAARRAAA